MPAKERDSNMELLRITAMLLVITFHVDFISFDFPTDQLSIYSSPISAYLKIWMTNATFTCVDVFIILSGWYGIHPRVQRLTEFLFQVFFYSILSYILFLIFDANVHFSWRFLCHLIVTDDYWFIPIYLSLYLFSPVLNAFIKSASQSQYMITICCALALQSMYGWLSPNEQGFLEGRSPMSFCILYLLARYIHLYADGLKSLTKKQITLIFIVINCLAAVIVFCGYYFHLQMIADTIYKFSSLFTISLAVLIVLFFYHVRLKSKIVNWIAASSFAVFLVHCFPYFNSEIYHTVIKYFYLHYDGMLFAGLTALFIIAIYAGSILIDQLRIALWKVVSKKFLAPQQTA